jgi:ferric iron reductase protein FhuF
MTGNMTRLLDEKYSLTTTSKEKVLFSFPATDLLDDNKLREILVRYTPLIKGLVPAVGEIYMAGWFRGPMLALLHLLTEYNQALHLSLDSLTIEIYEETYNERLYTSANFWMHNGEPEPGPADPEQNEAWTRQKVSAFFEQTVRPVFEAIERVGTQRAAMLWGQLPTSLQYGYDLLSQALTTDSDKLLLDRNLKLTKSLPGECFGRSRNPLDVKFHYTESLADPTKQVRMKNSCCMYYQIEGGYYCYTCPRLKESERDQRRSEYRAAQKV